MSYSIAIASGKGGAGKTSLAAALFSWLGNDAVLADCDVDAANAVIALGAKELSAKPYSSGLGYKIDASACTSCGRCMEVCRFAAISQGEKSFMIDEALCERCAYCTDVCPVNAILSEEMHGGELFLSQMHEGPLISHAELEPGEDTSGKLVMQVRRQAEAQAKQEGAGFIIVDAPPGIGCPVIAALSGVDLCVVVIEAGKSGMYDARRLFELLKNMKISSLAIINKAGIDPAMDSEAESLARLYAKKTVSRIPFDKRLRASTENGEAWIKSSDKWVSNLANKICKDIIDWREI